MRQAFDCFKIATPLDKDKIKREVIRYVLLALGIFLLTLGGLFFSCSGIGMDPLSVFYSGVAAALKIRLGTAALLVSIVVLICVWIFCRKRIGIGTIAVSLGIGPLLNLLLEYFSYAPSGWIGRGISSLAGVTAYGFGAAFYLYANLGSGPVDAMMLWLSEKTPLSLSLFKILFDAFCVATGWFLGGIAGAGTLIAVLLSGPIMCAVQKGMRNIPGFPNWEEEVSHEASVSHRAG